MELNESSLTEIVCSGKTLKKECQIHCELLTWEYGNITSNNQITIYHIVACLCWGVSIKTFTRKITALSV